MTLPVRPARESDMSFVIGSWRESFQLSAAIRAPALDRDHYFEEMARVIRKLCAKATVRVAHDPEDDDHLVGFAAFTPRSDGTDELHYVYVKRDFRGQGVARSMLADRKIATYTFLTSSARPPKGWRFTPRFTI